MQALISLVYQTKLFESVQIDFDYNLQSILNRRNELGGYDMWNRYDKKIFEMLFRKIHKQNALNAKLNSLLIPISLFLFVFYVLRSVAQRKLDLMDENFIMEWNYLHSTDMKIHC